MSTLTDAFDMVVQITEDTIDRIVQSQHQRGIMRHAHVRSRGELRAVVQLGRPAVALVTTSQPDQRARIELDVPVLYHSRAQDDATDLGSGATARANVRAVAWISTGEQLATLGNGAHLVIDWSETTAEDIAVHGAPISFRVEVREVLLAVFAEQGRVRVPLPPIPAGGSVIGSAAFRFLPDGPSGRPVLVAGMNLGNNPKGVKSGLQQVFVQEDWALALAREFVLSSIRDAMKDGLGDRLPPPHGGRPVVVSDADVCLLEVGGNCVETARQQVYLETFDVRLEPGVVVFIGQVRQQTDAFYLPDLTATFRTEASLAIGTGQVLEVSVSPRTSR